MGSESTIEVRDGVVQPGTVGTERTSEMRSGREASGHRNGSIGVEMGCLGRDETAD